MPRDTNNGLGEASAGLRTGACDTVAVVDATSSCCSDRNVARVKNNRVPALPSAATNPTAAITNNAPSVTPDDDYQNE